MALSDGYVEFDDLYGKLPGPVVVQVTADETLPAPAASDAAFVDSKPYFVGWQQRPAQDLVLPRLPMAEPADPPMLRTTLYDTHVDMGGRMVPFGGYEMPVWYSSVSEEHTAVRETAGLFDATHMGVFDASGRHVVEFLNTVTTNDVSTLQRRPISLHLLPAARRQCGR